MGRWCMGYDNLSFLSAYTQNSKHLFSFSLYEWFVVHDSSFWTERVMSEAVTVSNLTP